MKVVVDSNIFVSLYFETEKFHKKAREFYEKVLLKEIEPISSALMLPEICGSISRRIGKDEAKRVRAEIESLVKKGVLKLEKITMERINSATTLAIDLQIKGADSLFVSLAKELEAPFLTFDEEVKKKIKGKIKLFEYE
jgi:predicted nucleic acid-binding protein